MITAVVQTGTRRGWDPCAAGEAWRAGLVLLHIIWDHADDSITYEFRVAHNGIGRGLPDWAQVLWAQWALVRHFSPGARETTIQVQVEW